MQQIEIDFAKQAMVNISKEAHQLKSSSMNIAAKRLSELYKQLEETANKLDFEDTKKLWQPIIDEHHLVENVYKNLLQN